MGLVMMKSDADVNAMVTSLPFHFRVPGLSLDMGLVMMKSDADVNAKITSLPSSRTVELYVEHIGGVQFVETQLQPVQEDGLEFLNIDDGDVTQVESIEKVGDGDIDEPNSDESIEEDQYSDGSYAMTDDDALYETFVDDDVEFRGLGQSSQQTLENVIEDTLEGEEIVLSDAVCDTEDESPYSSDDDNSRPKHNQFKKFRTEHDMEDPKFVLGLIFLSATVFKDAIKQYAIKNQKNVKIVKNDKKRVKVKCEAGCPWVIYATKVLGEESYQVRTFKKKHKCGVSYTNRNINSAMIAKKYMLDLRNNPSMPITSFKERVKKELKVDVSKSQLYRAKTKAALLIYGNDIAQYGMLWEYCEELRRSNPGSTVVMDAPLDEETGQPRFNRLRIWM
ncbi:hypothetical protein RHSIM_Rhsim08G0208800 [Rhododendron simsii]|uniref:Transposase MuDR plant domain-containing protein n=1 Tax=Rhododendron simsii TaxID=118357 RepID=A0A834GNT1_RHOSS|nr:hypothetical protein RHSIM_Rhsim08G0208800 [Rhododendron simsii]